MSIENLIDEELETEIESLEGMSLGTEEYKVTVDGIGKLLDRSIELKKLEIETDEKIKTREFEQDLKIKQMEADKKDRFWKNVLTTLGIAIPAGCGIWGGIQNLKFEETGSFTALSGRTIMNSMFKFKK